MQVDASYPIMYCKNVPLKRFPIIALWEVIKKQLRRCSRDIERLLKGHLSGIVTCPLKLLKSF